ncbi:MAG: bifunctional alpha,alpha-trehalose-phosphate synthase (UDP-forming)/trehalose-phosphatase [candidate division WOR-3 bacterium]|nr:MAG: bifunctional alpha,alpha-trehalose-phosphate synthase (UDP-forming)/trehalose-phosphatase [candidate division WOR-3 bacterium]
MKRLLIVSNRLPVTVTKREGKIRYTQSVGGLATGLSSLLRSYENSWIGWPGIAYERVKDQKPRIKRALMQYNCHPVFLNQYDIEQFYYGFCNRIIWPLFHYFSQYATYNKNNWDSYQRVNQIFCNRIKHIAKADDIIWIHDYHLMLLPQLLRKELPHASIGFFLHIPFPSSEVFRTLPSRKEIVRGMLGADLVGFHTYDYAHHYLQTVRRLLGYEHSKAQVNFDNRIVRVDAFPMGIDYDQFHRAAEDEGIQREVRKIKKRVGERKIIVSIDRLDYTKGIAQRLEAFDYFLDTNPKYREKVTLILVAVPSRTGVEQYALLKREVDELISRINGKYGTIGWMPIWYLYRFLPFKNLVPLYLAGDVALITPIRDGMNLIAKEYLATKKYKKGVLILSEMAGASKILGEAIIVNPNDKEEIAGAIKIALRMPENEQARRNDVMQRRLQRYNVERWAADFLDNLSRIKTKQQELTAKNLRTEVRKKILRKYSESRKRLLLLDYDGTLVSFTGEPGNAIPDREIVKVLRTLADNPRNELVIVSGRDRATLDRWFGKVGCGLIAEHGVWFKNKKSAWAMIKPLKNDWKEQIQPILELYVDRTPGTSIEEKDYSIVWHYRKTDQRLGELRAGELKERLLDLASSLNLSILEGSKVIEVKNIGINKGIAAQKWIDRRTWDFIIAMGDDWTDEDTFEVVPEKAYSIKIGIGYTKAKYTIPSPQDARNLLKEFTRC